MSFDGLGLPESSRIRHQPNDTRTREQIKLNACPRSRSRRATRPVTLDEGVHVSTLHFHQATTSTPEQFLAALIDFGPGRSKLFGNSADDYLKVHHRGPADADVTEGSGSVWERLHYDWSDPNKVVMKTTDSNIWGGARATPIPLRVGLTERPMWTPSSCARARTSKDARSDWCSEPSARAFWKKHFTTPSRLSKPGTAKQLGGRGTPDSGSARTLHDQLRLWRRDHRLGLRWQRGRASRRGERLPGRRHGVRQAVEGRGQEVL